MKIHVKKFVVREPGETINESVKVTNFSQVYALQAGAYDHGSDEKNIASVVVSRSIITDSPVRLDIDNYTHKHRKKQQPLYFSKQLLKNEDIKLQLIDSGKAVAYPYRCIVTLFTK